MAKGIKTGGRQKGTANRITRAKEAAIADGGLTPLEWMLGVLRDDSQPNDRRDWAAEKAAPYCHPKLANVEHAGEGGGAIQHVMTIRFEKPPNAG
jgi:hypothetical protein